MLKRKRPPEQENMSELDRRSVGEDPEPRELKIRCLPRIQCFRQGEEGIEAWVQSRGVGVGQRGISWWYRRSPSEVGTEKSLKTLNNDQG